MFEMFKMAVLCCLSWYRDVSAQPPLIAGGNVDLCTKRFLTLTNHYYTIFDTTHLLDKDNTFDNTLIGLHAFKQARIASNMSIIC